ncbi:MFS transporter [Gracilibacillus alcaliphilus]|uniref:MFS transporter n=1 Tax=Gracilibacillus alcaliphilus TaxID=1401441 RepID=UPI001959D0E5|nr:MFS transporter [Gracilibacillus alcaliphilus]MBM7678768.1 EmrB/QacA subfamily drug resistance transporter [Gracilibacillus alcaliphilus]
MKEKYPTLSKPATLLGLFILLLAGFITIFDLFVVNVAIPSIQGDLGATFSQVAFIVAGYELGFAVLLIMGGRLGDRFGRRRLFIVGMLGFTITSALCGLAVNPDMLIISRVLQGLTAAMMQPQIYSSIRVNFTGRERGIAFSLLGMVLGLAAIAGQVLGGFIVEADFGGLGWRMIFLINIPIGIFSIILARFIPESHAPERPLLDWSGVIIVSLGLVLFLFPLIESQNHGWTIWSFLSLAASTLILFGFWKHQEKRRIANQQPLIDTILLRQSRFNMGGSLVLLIYSTSSVFFLSYALLVQTGLGLSPLSSGLLFVPCSIGFTAASMAAPRLVECFGTKTIFGGAVFYTFSFAVLIGQVWMAGGDLVATHLITALIFVGVGQGLVMTPLLNLVLGFVEENKAGMASGIISTLQQVGAAIGLAAVSILFGGVIANATGGETQSGLYASAFASSMFYNLIASLISAILLWKMAKEQAKQ